MKHLFLKISVELPKQLSLKVRHQYLLHDTVGGWYVNKLGQNLPPLNKSKLRKESQKEEDEIKRKLHKANQYWNYSKFQIH